MGELHLGGPSLHSTRAQLFQGMAKPSPDSNIGRVASPKITMFKNKLQEYTQKLRKPIPAYRSINEGFQHAPKFRSIVFVDGAEYTSKETYHRLRDAEQDAAKLAYECIISNAEQNSYKPMLDQDPRSSKSVLHEFTFKQYSVNPNYRTVVAEADGSFPVYVSTVIVGDKTFTGPGGKNKRDAEQSAARTALQTLLGPDSRVVLDQMMSSKRKHYGVPMKVKYPEFHQKKLKNTSAEGPGNASQEKRTVPVNQKRPLTPSGYRAGPGIASPEKRSVPIIALATQTSTCATRPSFGRQRNVQGPNQRNGNSLQSPNFRQGRGLQGAIFPKGTVQGHGRIFP